MTEMLQENQHSMDDLPDDALALNRLGRLFQLHRQAVAGEPFPDYATRLRWLAAVHAMLVEAAPRWAEAVSRDFGHRSPVEGWPARPPKRRGTRNSPPTKPPFPGWPRSSPAA